MELSIPTLGKVDLAPAPDGHWEFRLDYSGRSVGLDFNVDGERLTQGAVDSVARFIGDPAVHDGLARGAIRAECGRGGENPVLLYVTHHLEQFDAGALRQCFGGDEPAAVGPELFLSKLYLHRVGLYPGDARGCAVFDYSIGKALTDYVIAVRFESGGGVVAVEMES